MKSPKAFLLGLLLAPLVAKADTTCIGITSKNQDKLLSEQHPLNFLNCPCNCSSSSWLDNSRCTTCNHAHASSQVIQTAKTNGTFITFMTPSQAVSAAPTGDSTWFSRLADKVKSKRSKNAATKGNHFSETNK